MRTAVLSDFGRGRHKVLRYLYRISPLDNIHLILQKHQSQFIAMLFHRMGTIAHILASTELHCCSKNDEFLSEEALIEKNAVEIVKQMQKLRGIDGELDSESASSNRLAHRKTIHMLEKNRQKKRAIGTLDVAFKKRFFALSGGAGQDPELEGKAARKSLDLLFLLWLRRN